MRYDAETGLYYLQSRYYDPTTCRFINADGYILSGNDLIKHNLFAYCQNNPILLADPSGNDAIILADLDGLGHIGALVESDDGTWFHTYWGAPSEGTKIFASSASGAMDVSVVEYKGDTPDFYDDNLLDNINNSSGPYTGYDDYVYLYGDYSSCIEPLSNPNKSYDLLTNNCSQFTIRELSKVNNHNQAALQSAENKVLPKNSFNKVKNNVVRCEEEWYRILTFKERFL